MILSKYYHRYEPSPSGYGVPIYCGIFVYTNYRESGIFWAGYDYTVYSSHATDGLGSLVP